MGHFLCPIQEGSGAQATAEQQVLVCSEVTGSRLCKDLLKLCYLPTRTFKNDLFTCSSLWFNFHFVEGQTIPTLVGLTLKDMVYKDLAVL
jgi:hypothetical protein